MTRTFKPKEIAEKYSVSVDKVIAWIRRGELDAFDVGTNPGSQKPRYRISESALEAFELRRSVAPLPTRQPRRRKMQNVKEYF